MITSLEERKIAKTGGETLISCYLFQLDLISKELTLYNDEEISARFCQLLRVTGPWRVTRR